MKKALLSVVILMFSALAFASGNEESCTSVDLRDAVGPVRNQGDIGWCFANAGADLMGYEYRKELKGQQVSAIHVAMSFNEALFFRKAFDEGGSAFAALNLYLYSNKKVCLQKVEDELRENGLPIPLKEKLESVNQLKAAFDNQREDQTRWQDFFNIWEKLKKSHSLIFSMGEQQLLNTLQNSTPREFPHKMADLLCQKDSVTVKRKSTLEIWSAWMPFVDQDDVIAKIDGQLNHKNIVGLAYYASFLTSPTNAIESDSKHMSVLVGRKWNTKSQSCEYLIRNSWGTKCTSYQKNPVLKNSCEGGNIWVPEALLKKAMFGITYFKK